MNQNFLPPSRRLPARSSSAFALSAIALSVLAVEAFAFSSSARSEPATSSIGAPNANVARAATNIATTNIATNVAPTNMAAANGAAPNLSSTRFSVNVTVGSNGSGKGSSTQCYYGAPVVISPGYNYPGYGYGGGNVIVIGNGTTIINNPSNYPVYYGPPYGYPVVISPQFYNYGPGGFSAVPQNGFSISYGNSGSYYSYYNSGNFSYGNTMTPYNSLPASAYYYDPSANSNNGAAWNQPYNASYDGFGNTNYYGVNAVEARRSANTSANATTPGARDAAVRSVESAASADANGRATAVPAWPSDATTKATGDVAAK